MESNIKSEIDGIVFVIVENENKKQFKNENNNHKSKSCGQNDDLEQIEMKAHNISNNG